MVNKVDSIITKQKRKVTIAVPNDKKGLWKLTFGKGQRKRKTAFTILRAIETHLQARTIRAKTAIRVNYGKGYHNEYIYSLDPNYLIYATACFLEDYLSAKTMNRIEKRYG